MDRPYIHINCAASVDGKISRPDGSRLRISSEWDMRRVHRLRAEMGSILVGAGTIIMDDPKLTVKEEHSGRKVELNKIVLDGKGRIPATSGFLTTPGRSYVVTSESPNSIWLDSMRDLAGGDNGIEIIEIPGEDGVIDVGKILEELKRIGIGSILVEGGSNIIWEFVSGGYFDKITIYFGPILVGGSGPGIASGDGFSGEPMGLVLTNTLITEEGGILVEYRKGAGR
ncbi:MAG: RibD family protein [Thermoplasmatota archaeon]